MNQSQINISNQVITELGVAGFYKVWVTDLVKEKGTKELTIIEYNKGMPEDIEERYNKKYADKVVKTNLRCEYDGFGVRSKCIHCGLARRDKQHDEEKRCSTKLV